MIKLRLKYFNGEENTTVVVPTIFPDGTSQVYKIESITKDYRNVVQSEIVWQFENEAELIHIAQLSDLLDAYTQHPKPVKVLNVPFLPYSRQDKPISNATTFAERSVSKLINALNFDRVVSFDVHGITTINNLQKLSANETIRSVFRDNKYDIICYPDAGAAERYQHEDEEEHTIQGVKYRNKTTGQIEDYDILDSGVATEGKRVLIADDLCDQGGTFIRMCEILKTKKVSEIGLYVSHMIGNEEVKQKLTDAGIAQFYTTNSLTKNSDGIKVV